MIECVAYGVPAGLGDPMFDGIENRIARIAFGIPAVKGVEFGVGFGAAELRGSENNDAYRVEDGRVCPQSNSAGGILGGITTGLPVVWRMALKPTPSIGRHQPSVDLDHMENADLVVRGRHDPCIVPRASRWLRPPAPLPCSTRSSRPKARLHSHTKRPELNNAGVTYHWACHLQRALWHAQ